MKLKKIKFRLILFAAVVLAVFCLQYNLLGCRTQKLQLTHTEKEMISSELKYFPLALSLDNGAGAGWSFVDTWNESRSFGGDRHHEGTDIITADDTPGICPVISMSDGVIEKTGWLELGGWRIGVRTEKGIYLYYAHLESYMPDIKEGEPVSAGECLGFTGNSGYGPEGTTGQFVTHLHVGIYVPDHGSDRAVNPYPYLKELSDKTLAFHYGRIQ